MELARDVTLGVYLPLDSVLHRLDPRTKILGWTFLAVLIFSAAQSFAGLALFALLLLALVRLGRLPLVYVLSGLKPMLPIMLVMYAFQLLFSGSLYPEAKQVLWEWGVIKVTAEGAYLSTIVTLRVILLYLSVTVLTLTTSLVELTDGTEAILSPLRRFGVPANELAMIAAIAVRFVPTLIEEQEKIIKAQMARGARLNVGNVLARTRALVPILVPLFLNTLRRAEDLTVAMEARCYRGGQGRTKRRRLRLTALDWQAWGWLAGFGVALIAVRVWV